jgi:F0F1-type ATP synthase gamma subunit
MHAHIAIVAGKSAIFKQLFKDKIAKRKNKDEKIIIDFEGKVLYSAFKKIIDYLYLDDLNMLESIADFSEMMEVTKFAKQHKLD